MVDAFPAVAARVLEEVERRDRHRARDCEKFSSRHCHIAEV
jgi:hypothetical protein